MFACSNGWDIDDQQYLDSILMDNALKKKEKMQIQQIVSHRVRTLSQPKVSTNNTQSSRKTLNNSRGSIIASKLNLQLKFDPLDEVLQKKKKIRDPWFSISPNKLQTQQTIQNHSTTQRKQNIRYNIINMSSLLFNQQNSVQRSHDQLNKVLRRVYK